LVAPFDVTLFRLENEAKVNVIQPDILVICDQDKIDEKGRYKGTPALVVEVLSGSSKSKDMVTKLSLYQESGVKEYWVVNTANKEIYIYTFVNNNIEDFRTFRKEDQAQSLVFPGLAVECSKI
jgi:Uma2 family endonuclease